MEVPTWSTREIALNENGGGEGNDCVLRHIFLFELFASEFVGKALCAKKSEKEARDGHWV